ncbi:unnamed protein product, partial [Ectocarpus sp. 12 AP-2014]
GGLASGRENRGGGSGSFACANFKNFNNTWIPLYRAALGTAHTKINLPPCAVERKLLSCFTCGKCNRGKRVTIESLLAWYVGGDKKTQQGSGKRNFPLASPPVCFGRC